MNRQQRRAAQSEARHQAAIPLQGKTLTLEEAHALAVKEYGLGNLEGALAIFRLMTAKAPEHAGSWYSQGLMLQMLGRAEEALASYANALKLRPDYAEAYGNRGAIFEQLQRYEEALADYDKALRLTPNDAMSYNNRGNALRLLKRYEDALASFNHALRLKPDYADAHNNRGVTFREMKRNDEALADYDTALRLKAGYAEAYINSGVILQERGQHTEALARFDKALLSQPNHAIAYNNRGDTLRSLKRYDEALASLDKAVSLAPRHAEAYNNRGVALQEMRRYDEALASYERAIALKADYAEAYSNHGALLQEVNRHEEALASLSKAMALNPDFPYLPGTLLHTRMHICDWQEMDALFARLKERIEAGFPASLPFYLLPAPLSETHRRACAEIHVKTSFPPAAAPLWNGEKYAHDRIRIGYCSSDFRNHALSYLMAEFFELHDRSKFEVTAFSHGPPTDSAMRERLKGAFEHFIDVREKSDAEIATLARSLEIDVMVDLNGFTQGSRTGIFAMRPAPAQASYMGFPGTMGASYIDYIVADAAVIPDDHKRHYAEKIVRLPHSYWVIDSTRKSPGKNFTRREMGLPDNGFVFCCFNNNFKITPDVFDIWMRILRRTEGSVLWLLKGNETAARNLRAQAKARDVDEHRLVFAERLGVDDHLARHRLADLFLDTFHYNAHTTASDALWEGLPVLTSLGESFTGRVAASLLHAARLPEMITHSHAEYEALALELAANPQKLSAIREKLARERADCPLFNTRLFTRCFEKAFTRMRERTLAGLPPEDMDVRL